MKLIRSIYYSLCLLYIPLLFLIPLCVESDGFIDFGYSFDLLMLFLISLPLYIAFVELGLCVIRFTEFRGADALKKAFGIARALCALGILCGYLFLYSLSLILAAAVTALWLAELTVNLFRKRYPRIPSELKSPVFWISTVVAVALAALTCVGIRLHRENEVKRLAPDFEFAYEIGEYQYLRGESGSVSVYLFNRSGEPYVYEGSSGDFRPSARLFSSEDHDYVIELTEPPHPDDFGAFEIADGDGRETVFTFTIPDDAPFGSYVLHVSFEGCADSSGYIFRVKDPYSPDSFDRRVSVSNGKKTFPPLSCFLWTEQYDADTGTWLSGDGGGVYEVLADVSSYVIPSMSLDDGITLSLMEGGKPSNWEIYGMDRKKMDFSISSAEELSVLPSGKYYVTFSVVWQGDYIQEADACERSCYEYIFYLSVK